MNDEIKEWETQGVKHKVAFVLVSDGVSFHCNEGDSIVPSTSEPYVKNMVHRLVTYYSYSLKPIITEY